MALLFSLYAYRRELRLYEMENSRRELQQAINDDKPEAVRLALKKGADPNGDYHVEARDGSYHNFSMLNRAVHNCDKEIVVALLQAGARVDEPDLLYYSLLNKDFGVTEVLVNAGASSYDKLSNDEQLIIACVRGDCDRITYFLDHGASVNCTAGYNQYTPLMTAAYFQKPQAMKLLLSRGADIRAMYWNIKSYKDRERAGYKDPITPALAVLLNYKAKSERHIRN